jgi:sucrose-6-phosphate hydrolase SacC (GH32 family)
MQSIYACAALLLMTTQFVVADEGIVIADFEGSTYGSWKPTGTAFGTGPARGTSPGQMTVHGYAGKGLANSFNGGDDPIGRLTSPPVKIERTFITFLIGGCGWAGETCMNLVVDGKVVRTATGRNTEHGGIERLEPAAWDVREFLGRKAIIVIVDDREGGWGHINVDQVAQTNDRGSIALASPPVPAAKGVTREIIVKKRLLHFPVKNGAKKRVVTVSMDGVRVHRFEIELADADVDWWAPLDVSAWAGKRLSVVADFLPVGSRALDIVRQSDSLVDVRNLYREPLRPQLHFSAKRGWLNDPNGLVYANGEYHLFFQHNPYGCSWGNMHWGHATSRDLVHWQEHGDVLNPDDLGAMFSGSAVVDWNNTSGFGQAGKPPLVLIYTAAGNPTTQCIAYSTNGRTFTKFSGNPVLEQITGGNRDPKVFWHESTQKWVMVLYVEHKKVHTVHFFTSPNLRNWTLASITKGGIGSDSFLYECPDFFELPIDGDTAKKKWILSAANGQYVLGTFDGTTFTPQTEKQPGVRGRGFYAAQTYSDSPDGRRIQIGWCQAASPGMAFNQLQSLPCELTLRSTAAGVRLHRTPVKEIESLRDGPNQADSLASFRGELIELRAELDTSEARTIECNVRGAKIIYDARKQELIVNDLLTPAPLVHGKQRLIVYVDRTVLEVFASDGLTYVPLPFIPKAEDQSVSVKVKGGNSKITSLQVYKLKSLWQSAPQ